MIAGTFSKWKTRSFLPLGEFIKRILKNSLPSSKLIPIEERDYAELKAA